MIAVPRRDKQVTVTVYLPLRDADAANALLARVTDPSSASYGQFLTARRLP